MQSPRILVPTDFSELSRRALRMADQWARLFGGVVTPMYAYEAITDLDGFHFHGADSSITGDLPTIRTEIERALLEFAGRDVAADRLAPVLFAIGSPGRAIARASIDYDLVVISSHGRSGFARYFLGSVADKVIRLTPCPVLVVHDEPDLLGSGNPIVASDLSPSSAVALPLASALAGATKTTVELLYVFDARGTTVVSTEELDERVRAFARAYAPDDAFSPSTTVLITGESVQDAIVRHLGLRSAGVVVMSTVGREPTEHHLLGRAPSRLAREVSAPLLLVTPEPGRVAKRAALVE